MSSKPDGGPAFPVAIPSMPASTLDAARTHPGLTMRDWFAGMAMSGMLADRNYNPATYLLAADAYALADAMIEEREKKSA